MNFMSCVILRRGKEAVTTTEFFGKEVPFGMNLLFQCEKNAAS